MRSYTFSWRCPFPTSFALLRGTHTPRFKCNSLGAEDFYWVHLVRVYIHIPLGDDCKRDKNKQTNKHAYMYIQRYVSNPCPGWFLWLRGNERFPFVLDICTWGSGKWFQEASRRGELLEEGQKVGRSSSPRSRERTPWSGSISRRTLHAWTDGSFRTSAGLGWVIMTDSEEVGEVIAQGNKSLGTQQTAFDTEITAIEEVVLWFVSSSGQHAPVIHPDSTSAIVRASHTGAGPRQ